MYSRKEELRKIIMRSLEGEDISIDIKLYFINNPAPEGKIITEYIANEVESQRNNYFNHNRKELIRENNALQKETGNLLYLTDNKN